MKKFRSVVKKYVAGYIVVGVIALQFLLVSVLAGGYASRKYSRAVTELVSVSQLEQTVSELNEEMNMIYLYLSETEMDSYEEKRQMAEDQLAVTNQQAEASFMRELADTNRMVETYVQASDALKAQMQAFFSGDQSVDYDSLGDLYQDQQSVYTYVIQGFQSVYQVRLNELNKLEQDLNRLQNLFLGLECVFLVLAVLGCFAYLLKTVREISGSIRTMLSGIASIKENVFAAEPIRISSGDEFEEFADAFNEMIEIIQTQMKEIEENASIKKQLSEMEIENLRIFGELQKSHLDFLQSRMNPHFLFNTLNMISSLARLEHADKSARMTEITASYLRYNLDNISKSVTLRQEVGNLSDYIEIQKCRYGDRYRYEFEIAEDCMSFQMPCMILQPLVENAIQHGISMKISGGCVWVRAYFRQNRFVLEVRDNGVGMTGEQIEAFYRGLTQNNSPTTHIGLRNIYQRLQLFYHNDVQFELHRLDPGLEIRITLPGETGYELYNGHCG